MRKMSEDERARMENVLRTAKLNQEKTDSVDMETIETPEEYSVGIQLDKALANPGSTYDIELRENDRLIVPEFNNTVKISGSVLFPNTVAFDNTKNNYKWYVNQAGGFAQRAKKRKAFIVYQNGTVARATEGKVEPGCEIIVPTKIKRDNADLMQWISMGTSMASLATMFVSLANLLK
jgi:protein involved in polysaccharide export with SLBB domain